MKPLLRACVTAVVALAALALAASALAQNYVVLYNGNSVPANAGSSIANAGGTLVQSYSQIGVAIARSDNASFRSALGADSNVAGVAGTSAFATQVHNESGTGADPLSALVGIPAPGSDPLSGLQWDMDQIQAPAARAIDGGSPSIVVGDIDTGLDYTHPDLAPNVDAADSVNCVSGAPVQGVVAANDDNGHGTHTAGTIAAALNGIGIVGVAPNVKIAGIKAGNADGFFFPEAVVCAFVWAGTHNINVTNNSYFADPWYFNCKNDPEQRAIWTAERRAIRFAMGNGTAVVSATGNFDDDLAHPTMDIQSPDDTTPVSREVTNACAVIPVEVPGVVGVSGDGNLGIKTFYSNYGSGVVQVVAPGGDSILQRTAAAPNGRVLSTWPAALAAGCLRQVSDSGALYCYLQGTSMASPHAAGVAALIESEFGPMMPGRLTAALDQSADSIGCPDAATLALYAPFPQTENGKPETCEGGTAYNSWYGHGQVNALSAVTHSP
jgi:subtilisin family serine protease